MSSWVARVVRVLAGIAFAAQAVTIGTLLIVDNYRKRGRRHKEFPTRTSPEITAEHTTLRVYTYGQDVYDDMLAAIDAAHDRIYFETYIWKSDAVGQRFKDAFIAAAERGVEVHLVYDVFANLVVDPRFFRFPPPIKVLRHTPFNGIAGLWHPRVPGLNHRKLLIVDAEVAFIGGYNIGALYATRWRDTHARLRGETVAELDNAFVDYWNIARPPALPELDSPTGRGWTSPVRITRNVPSALVFPIRYMYLEAIDRAEKYIYLTHAYFIPDNDLTKALLDAVRRGVDVRIIVPAQSNHIIADWLSRGLYTVLLRGGVRIFRYQGTMIHAKTATIDGEWSTIGTANLDRLSLSWNYEINVDAASPDLAGDMEKTFRMDLANSVELTLDEWERRNLLSKASERILVPLRPFL
ncbi:phospholipase D-like domain-containing protein [Propionicicella superfundia]|uniref:phospholipase D-like domain-containing protein n=1 Tax=Propionicicella superfundia TaxID=348582 RepID=UPI0003FB3625|nr:phospholipase D-like domain-containing protein [Propionicicella superfundia]